MSHYVFDWNDEKNALLKEQHGVCFEDIVAALGRGKLLADEPHFNQKDYAHQRLFIVEVEGYAFVVPYVENHQQKTLFLKTLYRSRKFTNAV